MTYLRIDLETYSSVDLKACGLHKYVESEDFEILILAYAFDDEPVRIVDLASFEPLPAEFWEALTDPAVIKTAYNAAFEIACLRRHFDIDLDLAQWRCTAVHGSYLGLPGYLAGVAEALKTEAQKDSKGTALINYFSKPCKPTKTNKGRTRNMPEHAPAKWEDYKAYCGQDVETERDIARRFEAFPVPESEWALWRLDQKINNRGVYVDRQMVDHAMVCDKQFKEILRDEAIRLTGIDNPNSRDQLLEWLAEEGLEAPDLRKTTVPELIEAADSEAVRRVLEIRQELSKTSIKKYAAIAKAVCADGRLRGTLQFYGAGRTGRWSGRIFQPQNLPRNSLKADLGVARELLKAGDYKGLEMLFESVPDVLSQLIRTSLIPVSGRFQVADFNAIEARVVAWLAGEEWVLEVFRTHSKIYEATASGMYGIPIESVTKDSEWRQKGKTAVLACGYGGGPNALIAMGALRDGLKEEELKPIVDRWRAANPQIVKLWKLTEKAAIRAVQEGGRHAVRGLVSYVMEGEWLFALLPNGRRLAYYKPRIEQGQYGPQLSHEGVDQKSRKWVRRRTWGGTLVENNTQAIARDCLAVAIERVEEAGFETVLHVHDEVICEGTRDVKELCELMAQPIDWAPGLPLKAAGFETDFYMKD